MSDTMITILAFIVLGIQIAFVIIAVKRNW